MSATTTDNARVTSVRHYFADDELHHSQPSEVDAAAAPAPDAHPLSPDTPASNPTGWQNQWRRVPAYRPVNHQLDDQRNTFTNEIEHNFIRVMFGGVYMMSTASHFWRTTVGKLHSGIWEYKIGGEW